MPADPRRRRHEAWAAVPWLAAVLILVAVFLYGAGAAGIQGF